MSSTARRLRRKSRSTSAPLFQATFPSITAALERLELWAAAATARGERLCDLAALINNTDQANVIVDVYTRAHWKLAAREHAPEVIARLDAEDAPEALLLMLFETETEDEGFVTLLADFMSALRQTGMVANG